MRPKRYPYSGRTKNFNGVVSVTDVIAKYVCNTLAVSDKKDPASVAAVAELLTAYRYFDY
ncbi:MULTISPECIES: hypothetical protein [unclassified Streptococcus]|uniref:hypothetical protein n=1 Tax=unclassified Streptococcus TaxID=2608887 RepID=UPI00211AECF3|nr:MULTISPECIES: hypothetical protein [unclassified Streptococcus]MCQ9211630.1 hypothetical protein [Streptococcus sp. B01]MCQ9213149.1 hypothetical protein [Streptococcus sp. O1]MCQ9214937.1 hypothetical protein [Streptococcus sp. O1]MCQ9215070.1 hypothetical protein [Streptococcus sp. O1]